jgi:SAM-dependent methyltransferase
LENSKQQTETLLSEIILKNRFPMRTFENIIDTYEYSSLEFDKQRNINWLERNHIRFYEVLNIFYQLVNNMTDKKNLNILDMGLFPGTLFKIFKNIFSDETSWRYSGAGLIENQEFESFMGELGVELYKTNFDPLLTTKESINVPTRLPVEDNSFDFIFCLEVIEHLTVTSYLIEEMYRLLKPGGYLIVTTPNLSRLGNRIKLMFGRSILELATKEVLEEAGGWRLHFREYTMSELMYLFENENFIVKYSKFMNLRWHENLLKQKSFLYRHARSLFDLFLDIYSPFSFGLLLVLQKSE